MGTYNYLPVTMDCPRCHETVDVIINCYFGYTSEMKTYRIGDHYEWRPRKAVQNGGKPEGGNADGEGYADCPACDKDFFVRVVVRGDIIQGVEHDPSKPPFIGDDP
jgi:hypothetical protein